jgi:hypothetical protein
MGENSSNLVTLLILRINFKKSFLGPKSPQSTPQRTFSNGNCFEHLGIDLESILRLYN